MLLKQVRITFNGNSIMDYAFEYAPRFPILNLLRDTTATVEVVINIAYFRICRMKVLSWREWQLPEPARPGNSVSGVNTSIIQLYTGYVDGALYQS